LEPAIPPDEALLLPLASTFPSTAIMLERPPPIIWSGGDCMAAWAAAPLLSSGTVSRRGRVFNSARYVDPIDMLETDMEAPSGTRRVPRWVGAKGARKRENEMTA
jgi:hypothetical protein